MDKHLDADALSDYAEGLPDARARASADAHLAGCARCRAELAAVQAYFRGMADLEPARAPADFLAKVRDRLPRPSPWARAWAALLLPFHYVPVPIAVAVILGVTAITVYMRQGGPGSRREVLAPAAAGPDSASGWHSGPAAPASEPEASAAVRNSPAASLPYPKEIDPEIVGSASPAPVSEARKRRSVSRDSRGAGGGTRSARPDLAPSALARPPVPPMAPPAKPAPAPPAGSAPDPSGKLRDADAVGWLDNPSSVYMMDNSGSAGNLPLDKAMPVEGTDAVPGQAEAAASHAAGRQQEKAKGREEGEAEKDYGGAQDPSGKKAAPARIPSSGYAVSLRAKSDTAAVLAGLRSMGIEAEPEYASSGECRYRLGVPAPMLRELGPYLARHGESRVEGPLPAAASGSAISLRLRLLFPAR